MPKKPQYSKCTFFDMNDEIESRMVRITEELAQGFHLIKSYHKSVTFFGSARFEESNQYYKRAVDLARRIGKELEYAIVTGGGPAIMEAANKGAKEAGVTSAGFTIKLPMEQITNNYLTHQAEFNYFFTRKLCMTYAAEAYIYFPGGYGTLDEFFEILTLVQTGKIERVPLILVGAEFWKPLLSAVTDTCKKFETIDDSDATLFTITDDEEEILRILREAPIRTTVPAPTAEVVAENMSKSDAAAPTH